MANDFRTLLDLGKKLLGFRTSNHTVHATNVANAATPQYKAKELSFEAELNKVLKNEGALFNNIDQSSPWNLDVKKSVSRAEPNTFGNNVKVDQEMAAMTENAMQYLATVKIISKQLALQKYAASGN